MINDLNKLEQELNLFIEPEKNKIKESIENKIRINDQKGISQMIGRRYGFIWENIVRITLANDDRIKLKDKVFYKDFVKKWIEENTANLEKECCKLNSEKILMQFLEENTGTSTQDLCDFTFQYNNKIYAVDTKYKFNSNDSNTVREIANSAIHLQNMGYIPVLLLRTNRAESQQGPILRFERNGWNIIDDNKAIDFIEEITGYNLNDWINENMKIWEYLSEYQEELEKLRFGEDEWIY